MNDHIRFALTSLQRRAARAALATADQLIYDDDCAARPVPLAPEGLPIICVADGMTCRVEFDTSNPAAPRITVTFVKAGL